MYIPGLSQKSRATLLAGVTITVILFSFSVSTRANAEQVKIPLGQQGKHWQVKRPPTGASKAAVEMEYGAPLSTTDPVGQPPISTWEYEGFNVYFEYDHVIHSVVKAKANP